MSAVLASSQVLAEGPTRPGWHAIGVWLNDPSNWWGENGLLYHLRQHVFYTVVAVLIAFVIAVPIGLVVGHTRRGAFLVGGLANGLRAVPALGLLVLLELWLSPKINVEQSIPGILPRAGAFGYFLLWMVALILLAIPPILINTYAGVQNVDPEARDAAKGMGMTGWQVVRKVELPIALPLVLSGVRSAVLQVIATATIAAYAPFGGGLGGFIINGASQINSPSLGYPAMVGAGVVIAGLALVSELLLIIVQRYSVSRGLTGRYRRSTRVRSAARAGELAEVELVKA